MFNLANNILVSTEGLATEGNPSLIGSSEPTTQTLNPEQAEFSRLLAAGEEQNQTYSRDGASTSDSSQNQDGTSLLATANLAAPTGQSSASKQTDAVQGADKKQMLLNMLNPDTNSKTAQTAQDTILNSAETIETQAGDKHAKTKEEIKERLKTLQASFQGSALFQALSSPQQLSPDLLSENRFLREASKVVSLNQYLDKPVPLKAFLPKLGLDESAMHEIMQSNDFKGATMAPSEIFASLGLSPDTVKEKILALRATEDMTSKVSKDAQKPNETVIAKASELPQKPAIETPNPEPSKLVKPASPGILETNTQRASATTSRHAEAETSSANTRYERSDAPAETQTRAFFSNNISWQETPPVDPTRSNPTATAHPDLQARNLFDLQQSRLLENPIGTRVHKSDSETNFDGKSEFSVQQLQKVDMQPAQSVARPTAGLNLAASDADRWVESVNIEREFKEDRPEEEAKPDDFHAEAAISKGFEALHSKSVESHFSKEISANRSEAIASHSNTDQIMKAIAEHSQVLLNDKGGQVNIQLNANETSNGPIGLEIVVDNNKVDVKIASDDMDLKREMHAAIDALQANLGHKNLQLSDVKFTEHQDFSQQNQAGQQFFNQQNRQSFAWDQQLKDYVDSETGVPDFALKKPLGKISPYQDANSRYKIGLSHPQGNIQLLA